MIVGENELQLLKKSLKKFRLSGIRTLSSAIPVKRSNQWSQLASWELPLNRVRNTLAKDEDKIFIMNLIYKFHTFELRSFVKYMKFIYSSFRW